MDPADLQEPSDGTGRPRVLLLERHRAAGAVVRKYLEEAGYEVHAHAESDRLARAAVDRPPELVVAGAEAPDREGEALCRRLREAVPEVPIVLLYEPGEERAEALSEAAGADGWVVAPIRRPALQAAVRAARRLRDLQARVEQLEARLTRAAPEVVRRPEPGSYDLEFFKKMLRMEVKRSRRYAQPVSLALVAFDRFPEASEALDPTQRGRLVGSLLAVISRSVRDIDLPILYAEDKVLVLMPQTAGAGALVVGGRLRDRIRAHEVTLDRRTLRLTASIGIAAFDGQGTVSFGGLMKGAGDALRRAQVAGGDAVEAASAPARSRVSLG